MIPKMNLEIRKATIDECETIFDLWIGSARWLQSKGIDQWNPSHFKIDQVRDCFEQGYELFLARWRDEVVGTCMICWSDAFIWKELDHDDAGYIHRFAVSRRHVGLAIGRQLLQWAEDYIRSQGKHVVRLDCMTDNPRLNQYYQSCGYEFVRVFHWDNGWRANLYEKKP
ncbi:GNAT family N-acetyltransferase [Paenibacillus guangzhouensis]|uniref:GNAT family N-acetyltransferase n=1 Tax=Paenibacillus guangzhouensis TaxID=1473112 RepID=UPI001266D18C|nr:GNAT family N-acetyltransferase [Paenibacillus guangzhouensis]